MAIEYFLILIRPLSIDQTSHHQPGINGHWTIQEFDSKQRWENHLPRHGFCKSKTCDAWSGQRPQRLWFQRALSSDQFKSSCLVLVLPPKCSWSTCHVC